MNVIYLRTFFITFVMFIGLCVIVIASLWWQNRKRFPEIGLWFIDFALQFVALWLITLRGIIPDFISIVAANVFIIGGTIILYDGLCRYVRCEIKLRHNYVMLAVFTLVHAYLTYIHPSMPLRTVNQSLALIYICVQAAWLMLFGVDKSLRSSTKAVGIIFIVFCLIGAAQVIVNLTIDGEHYIIVSGTFGIAASIMYQISFVALTFALFLMFSRRLSMGLENEIARREQEEKIIKARLSLLEFAATHTLSEVLQEALDEICLLAESPIGFYHFVEEDQKTLSLQAWSTRTLNEFCKAEGKGRHYNIEEAGVWVDCFYQKRPVIHNDYSSLTHRKGLPDGHAPVMRELVVPIMRGGQVMAILGLGNKSDNYNDEDVEVVSYLADVAWEITLRKKAEEAHRRSEEKYKQLAEAFPETIFEADMKGLITYANPHAFNQFGFTKEDMAKGINIFDQIHPADLKLAEDRIQSGMRGENKSYLEYQTLRKDGTVFHALALSAPIIENEVPVGIRGFILDISELKKTEEALRQSEARFQAIANSANDAIIMTDNNGNISYWNPAAERIIGYTAMEAIGKNLHKLIAAEQFIPSYLEAFPEFQKTGKGNVVGKRLEMIARRKDGREIDITLSLSAVKIEGSWHAVGIVQDITERKQAEEQIKHMATHDLLTDLPTMRLAMDRLSLALNMAHRYKKGAAVMFIDLDGFKNVNDTLGHAAGDYVLKIVAQRLLSCVRGTDTVARVGGDEFLIIATEINSTDNVAQIAEKVLQTVSQAITFNGRETAVGTSIGIALFPEHGDDMNKLIKLADEAMYKVKNAGKNGYRFVDM